MTATDKQIPGPKQSSPHGKFQTSERLWDVTGFGGSASSPTTAKPLMWLLYPRPRIKSSKAKAKAVVLLPDLPFLSQADWQQQNRLHAFKQMFWGTGRQLFWQSRCLGFLGSIPRIFKKGAGDQIDVGVEDCNPGYMRSCLKTLLKNKI